MGRRTNPTRLVSHSQVSIDEETIQSIPYEQVIITFQDANDVEPVGYHQISMNTNFILGNDPKLWYKGVPSYSSIIYWDIYDGIDLLYYYIDDDIKYEYIVHPYADPSDISVRVGGHSDLSLIDDDCLAISASWGELFDSGLIAYYMDTPSSTIACSFDIKSQYEFDFDIGDYDRSKTLIIDPVIFSTFIGGEGYDFGDHVVVDAEGFIYSTGRTNSIGFPNTSSAYRSSFNGGLYDVFISKLTPDGDSLVFSTYLGGSASDEAYDISLNELGNIIICGMTTSRDFPTAGNPAQSSHGGDEEDGFICALSNDGSSLLFSTFLGGNGNDTVFDITVDANSSIYCTGWSSSSNLAVTTDAYQSDFTGVVDVLIAILSEDGKELTYLSYLGGEETDMAFSLLLIEDQGIYLAGKTGSKGFPNTTGIASNRSAKNEDAFLVRLSPDRTTLMFTLFLNGSSDDWAMELVFGEDGSIYITGTTFSLDFPTTTGAYQTETVGGDVFVAKIDAIDSTLIASTYLGGFESEFSNCLSIDPFGNLLVVGTTGSSDFPTTSDAMQKNIGGDRTLDDLFIAAFSPDLKDLRYSTYLGGSREETSIGLVVEWNGQIILSGKTSSPDFPVTYPTFQDMYGGGLGDAFIIKLQLFNETEPPTAVAGPDVIIEQHEEVTFDGGLSTDNIAIVNFSWEFEYDGNHVALTGIEQRFVFDQAGIYDITLIAHDFYGNVGTDKFVVEVTDTTPPTSEAGQDLEIDQHQSVILDGINSSDNVAITRYQWKFNYNGSNEVLDGEFMEFTFHTAGEYVVSLTVSDEVGSSATDEVIITVNDITLPIADAGDDQTAGQGDWVILDGSTSIDNIGIVNWTWRYSIKGEEVVLFGTSVSISINPVGLYIVELTVSDVRGNEATDECLIDVADTMIPSAKTSEDLQIEQGERASFDAASSSDNVGVVEWIWSFEYDGENVELNGVNQEFRFDKAGKYRIILTVRDEAGNEAEDFLVVDVLPIEEQMVSENLVLIIIIAVILIVGLLWYYFKKSGS